MATNFPPKSLALRLYIIATAWGFDPVQFRNALLGMRNFRRMKRTLKNQANGSTFKEVFPLGSGYPCYNDHNDNAGTAAGHYFHQDLIVARDIFKKAPIRHIDVGSSVNGFVSHVASFREIDVIDIRPLGSQINGINFVQKDVMEPAGDFTNCTDSLSCLHALEHFGLGRYGDPVNFDGWMIGLSNLIDMVKPGGTFYLSVPTGMDSRIEFNAHRVFSLPFLRTLLSEIFEIERVAFVLDNGSLIENVDLEKSEFTNSFNATYGCSIWFLKKK